MRWSFYVGYEGVTGTDYERVEELLVREHREGEHEEKLDWLLEVLKKVASAFALATKFFVEVTSRQLHRIRTYHIHLQ